MTKLSVGIMARDEIEFIQPCILSLIGVADEVIIVLDSRTRDGTKELVTTMAANDPKIKVLIRNWDSGSGQKQFLKEQCSGDWILFVDADEIYDDDIVRVKDVIEKMEANGKRVGFIRTHHFMFHFGAEDATVEKHYTPHRLMKNDDDLNFPSGQTHARFNYAENEAYRIDEFRMYHYGSCKNMFRIRDKYYRNSKIDFHTKEFNEKWKGWNYSGTYPCKSFKPEDHPLIIRKFYMFENLQSEAEE